MGEARRKMLAREELERKPLWYQLCEAIGYYVRRFVDQAREYDK